jgi:hypothetical protein
MFGCGFHEGFDEYFIWLLEGLPSIADKFCYDSVVFSSAGFGAEFAEIVHCAADSDEGSAGRLVAAILGELFFEDWHVSLSLEKGVK